MNEKKQMTINMIASMLNFIINLGINFILSPYLISNVGTEAYGFVSLANNFVNYATIITIALNSMSSRFITIEMHRNNKEEANKYFNSVLVANLIIILILIIPSIILIMYLEKFLNIPNDIIIDIKLLFSLIFANFFVTIIDSVYSVATFATNKLYLRSIKTIESNLLKVGILILLFTVFKPSVFYVGIAAVISSIFLLVADIKYTKKLLTMIEIGRKNFSIKKIVTLITAGIWNTITKLGNLLSDGLDLIVCNLLISPIAMGQLAIAKTIGNVISTLVSTVSSIFQPQLTIYYAKGQNEKLVEELKNAMKMTGFFANIPFVFIVIFGKSFYKLWAPTENSSLLTILTVLTIQGVIVSGAITPLYSVYTITNKIKADAIWRVLLGFLSVILVYILLNITNLGIYAVAGVSTIIGTIFNFVFVPTYAAYCLKQKWTTFYPNILTYIITTIIILLFVNVIKSLFQINNWIELIIAMFITILIASIINYLLLFNKQQKKQFIETIKNKINFRKKGK